MRKKRENPVAAEKEGERDKKTENDCRGGGLENERPHVLPLRSELGGEGKHREDESVVQKT